MRTTSYKGSSEPYQGGALPLSHGSIEARNTQSLRVLQGKKKLGGFRTFPDFHDDSRSDPGNIRGGIS